MAIYQVEDPQGQIHEIEGPDGATPDEVMAQAQQVIPKSPLPATSVMSPEYQKEHEPLSLGGAARNLAQDVSRIPGGLLQFGKQLVTHPIETAKSIPKTMAQEGERLGIPQMVGGEFTQGLEKFGRGFYNKPATSAMDIAAVLGAAEGAAGGLKKSLAPRAPAMPKPIPPEPAPVEAPPAEVPAAEAPPAPAAAPVQVMAAPLRGYSAPLTEAKNLLSSPEYQAWTNKIRELGDIKEIEPSVGGWIDTETKLPVTEPSTILKVADDATADYVAARIGSGLGKEGEQFGAKQQGVLKINENSPTPNGTTYEIKFNSPENLEKWHGKLKDYGLEYNTVRPASNSIVFADEGDSLANNIASLVEDTKKAGDFRGINQTRAAIKLIGEADYPEILARGTQGNIGRSAAGPEPVRGTVGETPGAKAGAAAGVTDYKQALKDYLSEKFGGLKKEAAANIPEEISGYLGQKAKQVIGKPGVVEAYSREMAHNLAMKSLGFSPGMIRKINKVNPNAADALASYALEHYVGPGKGDIGVRNAILKDMEESGGVVGDMRELATQRGAAHNMKSLIQSINTKLGDRYTAGLKSSEQSQYMKALEEIVRTPPTPDKIAQTVTTLFQESKSMDRLRQPSGALADVARELRAANDKLIGRYLHPDEMNVYHNALDQYGKTRQLFEGAKMKQARDMGGRLGPGFGIIRGGIQKMFDVVGYRTQAQIANRLANWLQKNPEMTKHPKAMMGHLVDEAIEAIDEIGGEEAQ